MAYGKEAGLSLKGTAHSVRGLEKEDGEGFQKGVWFRGFGGVASRDPAPPYRRWGRSL